MVFTSKNIGSNQLYLLLTSAARNTFDYSVNPIVYGQVMSAIEAYMPLLEIPEQVLMRQRIAELEQGPLNPVTFPTEDARQTFLVEAGNRSGYYCTDDILLYALRYAVGRETYVTEVVGRYLLSHLDDIDTFTLKKMLKHLKVCADDNRLGDPKIDELLWDRLTKSIEERLAQRARTSKKP